MKPNESGVRTNSSLKKGSRKLIVVVGMHRSGTSAITRSLLCTNVEIGNNLIEGAYDNEKGYWEDSDIVYLNEEMLKVCGETWDSLNSITEDQVEHLNKCGYNKKAVNLLTERISKYTNYVFKDPRMSKLLLFWTVLKEMDLKSIS